jgi:prepilin-type N-terminal cleavage/methylation domain-containing protein
MSNKRGFTLIELLIVVVIVSILSIAAIPIISSNTSDARSSEARAALGTLKDRARTVYQRTKVVPSTLAALGVTANELGGTYFTNANYSYGGTATAWTGTCSGVYASTPTSLIITSNLNNGSASFNR